MALALATCLLGLNAMRLTMRCRCVMSQAELMMKQTDNIQGSRRCRAGTDDKGFRGQE